MWRQVFVICLLITLSDFWSGTEARLEELDFEKAIDWSRKHFEEQRRRSENERTINAGLGGTGNGRGEIAKDVDEPGVVKEPEQPAVPDAGSQTDPKTGEKTQANDTGKTTLHTPHGSPQHLSGSHHKNPEMGSMFAGNDVVFLVTIAACSVAGLVGIIMAGVCWYKLNRSAKAASDVEYPAYGVTGPNKERIPSPGDRKLAQSAQMYHYQHQKQQMIAMEKANGEMKHDASDDESEEENEEGDYTVYECPGLAPTGEMEVKNPLFSDETPVTPSAGDDKKDGSN